MKNFRFSIFNLALFGGLLLVSAFLWLDTSLGYQTEGVLLVQSTSGNHSEETLAETIGGFGDTGQFVKRTLSSTRLQASDFSQLGEREQVAFLVKNTKTTGGNEGGIVRVVVHHQDSDRVLIVAEESMETLLRMVKSYYPEESVSVRVVDQPEEVTRKILEPVVYAAKVGVSALLAFFVLNLVFSSLAFFRGKKLPSVVNTGVFTKKTEVEKPEGNTAEMFVPQKLDPKVLYGTSEGTEEKEEIKSFTPLPKASETVKREVFGGYSEPQTGLASVSVTMAELPFRFEGDEEQTAPVKEVVAQEIIDPEEHPLEAYIAEQEAKQHVAPEAEPSVLEYKKRLNELLAQK